MRDNQPHTCFTNGCLFCHATPVGATNFRRCSRFLPTMDDRLVVSVQARLCSAPPCYTYTRCLHINLSVSQDHPRRLLACLPTSTKDSATKWAGKLYGQLHLLYFWRCRPCMPKAFSIHNCPNGVCSLSGLPEIDEILFCLP